MGTLRFNPFTGAFDQVAPNATITFQTDVGTSPVGNIITLTSTDGSVTITGNATTDTINLAVAGSSVGGFTTGSVIFADSTGTLAQDNANFFWDDTNNRLGIGTNSPSSRLDITESYSDPAAATRTLTIAPTVTLTANNAFANRAISSTLTLNQSTHNETNANQMAVSGATIASGSSGTVTSLKAILGSVSNTGGGTVTDAMAFLSLVDNLSTGTITNAYGVLVNPATNSGGGTITNAYGINIASQTAATNNWQLYSSGTAPSYFAGSVGIGTVSPTKNLSFSGQTAQAMWMERHTTANTAGNALTIQGGGATSGATDKNGGDCNIYSGIATGLGTSNVLISVYGGGATGTADNTLSPVFYAKGGSGSGVLPIPYIGSNATQPGTAYKGAIMWGVRDASADTVGQVGETVESVQSVQQTAAASGTYLQLNTISLTAGKWILSSFTRLDNATTTFTGDCESNIATATASTTGTNDGINRALFTPNTVAVNTSTTVSIPSYIVNISSTTSYYQNVVARYSVNAPKFVGSIRAVRIR